MKVYHETKKILKLNLSHTSASFYNIEALLQSLIHEVSSRSWLHPLERILFFTQHYVVWIIYLFFIKYLTKGSKLLLLKWEHFECCRQVKMTDDHTRTVPSIKGKQSFGECCLKIHVAKEENREGWIRTLNPEKEHNVFPALCSLCSLEKGTCWHHNVIGGINGVMHIVKA